VPSEIMPALIEAMNREIPVVLTSRVQDGFLSPTYGTGGASGGGFDLMQAGVIPSPHWRSAQARIALMAAIGANLSQTSIRALLEEG